MRSFAREPLVHFALVGLLIWIGVGHWKARDDRYVIRLTEADRQQIATSYRQQYGRAPTQTELAGLVDRRIQEEIYWREGLALGLATNDEIVRRRVAQKYEFLLADLSPPAAPSETQLANWYAQHVTHYRRPEEVRFDHIYFSADENGETRARKVLSAMNTSDNAAAPATGDSFPGPTHVGALSPEEGARLFGQSELTEKLFEISSGHWSGPYRSGYGWHLVYVREHSPAITLPLEQIHERVLTDYQDQARRAQNARAFAKVRTQYTVQTASEGG